MNLIVVWINFETAELGNGNAVGVSMDIDVLLDSKLSFCAPGENGNDGDGYFPRDFACLSEGPINRVVRLRLAA